MGGSRVVAGIMSDAGENPSASDGESSSFGFSPSSPQSTAASAMECDCDSANSSMVEVVRTMMKQEDNVYAYERYRPSECQTVGIKEKWRQDICHWVSKTRVLLLRFAPNRIISPFLLFALISLTVNYPFPSEYADLQRCRSL